ncbi:amidohydrolase [Ochrobactrum sp. 695/2009]|nr:M20 aminoacylase family protein [Brucella intermedia]PJR91964.1 amidohydrolase [Ochrobactrum sp. 721/2009]PJT15024.1 amidohydrolase [Ochrobactrum sp. 720/2009]PJT20140.1 amidohydrolase [Ochrobactrum sp. 715/2009]PJT28110.1 amidohydrolase [Ochrobactrum sp. 695/2009]PJT34572.1 amidohydrolase [Ochrobactrum sp. 689/2009]
MDVTSRPRNRLDAARESIAAHLDEFITLRHDIHQHPELAFHEHRTSRLVASKLASWGYDVTAGIAGTGVVATLVRGEGQRRLAIRADMDALPIEEATGLDYASRNKGVMHACGHDGHTTILLAAARYLAEEGDFSGTLDLVFQPAEEIGAGARKMISEGLFEQFPVDAVFGLHNWPGVTAGRFGFVAGPAMASVDKAVIKIVGKGGHGAEPHNAVDPIVAAASLITALQSIVSRNVDPREMAVVTVGSIHGGEASNVIPGSVELQLTIRSYSEEVRRGLQVRIPALARAQAESFGAVAEVDYRLGFPSVINPVEETAFARKVAADAFGDDALEGAFAPRTASEDFAFLLQAKPGSYLFIGNGDSAPLHSAEYNFNDQIIAPAALYWVQLAEAFLNENRR